MNRLGITGAAARRAARLVLVLCLAATAPRGVARAEDARPEDVGAAVRSSADLPLRRDPPPGGEGRGVRAAIFLALLALGGAAVVALQRRRLAGSRGAADAGWKRWLAAGADVPVRVRFSARLSPRASVHVVEWNGEEWLVGAGDAQVTLLGKRTLPPKEAP